MPSPEHPEHPELVEGSKHVKFAVKKRILRRARDAYSATTGSDTVLGVKDAFSAISDNVCCFIPLCLCVRGIAPHDVDRRPRGGCPLVVPLERRVMSLGGKCRRGRQRQRRQVKAVS